MFNNDSSQAYREAIMALKEELREKDKLIKELTDKIMSRDFTEYVGATQPTVPEPEIKPEDDPYIDPEDVPSQTTDDELGEALKR